MAPYFWLQRIARGSWRRTPSIGVCGPYYHFPDQFIVLLTGSVHHRQTRTTRVYSVGLRCSGPGAVQKSSSRLQASYTPCPYETILDLDNSFLSGKNRVNKGENFLFEASQHKSRPGYTVLGLRCAACEVSSRLEASLVKLGLISDDPQTCCSDPNCIQPTWYGTNYCQTHIFSINPKWSEIHSMDIRVLQQCISTAKSKRWNFDSDFEAAITRTAEIREGKRPGSDLVVLDLEFLPSSGQILEIAVVESVSGKILLDTKVKHDCLNLLSNKLDYMAGISSFRMTQKFFGKSLEAYTQNGQDVHAIAKALKSAGITKQTIILVWHSSWYDLTLLQGFLEAAGYSDILPSKENCVRLVPFLWMNMPPPAGRRRFPGKLEVIFPLFFPCHKLIGMNHHALEDCLQTRLLMMAFEKLVKPLKERRGWQPTDLVQIGQRTLGDWVLKPLPKD